MEVIHKKKSFACDKCEKVFGYKGNLKSHISSKHEEHKSQCNQCDKTYTDSSSLKRHVKTVHAEKKFTCVQCDKKFKSKAQLQRHQISGCFIMENGLLKCNICDNSYALKSVLKKHQKSQIKICWKPICVPESFKPHIPPCLKHVAQIQCHSTVRVGNLGEGPLASLSILVLVLGLALHLHQ